MTTGTERPPIIDLDHLRVYTAGDIAMEGEILGLFMQQIESWGPLVEFDAQDMAWRDAAHTLKGAARGVGAWRVGACCEAAEALTADTSPVERSLVLQDLREALLEAFAEAQRLRGR